MRIFTIGFTRSTAERFFTRLKSAGTTRLIDVRLNNVSQLAGFAKRDDLKFFASSICGMDYEHLQQLAPTKDMLDAYKKDKGSWDDYETKFVNLLRQRSIESLDRKVFDGACLLCSEDAPHHCHRRLVAEYLQSHWPAIEVVHL